MTTATAAPATISALAGRALLRSAGLPIEMWIRAGAPDLFALLRRQMRAERRYAELAARLAESIGAELVAGGDLPAADRRAALALRRRLHNGALLTPADEQRLTVLTGGRTGLSRHTSELRVVAATVRDTAVAAERALDSERRRLLPLSWELLTGHAVGQQILAQDTAASARDVAGRLAAGEPWTSKRLRRRSAYLWRMIARGAAKTTPRGWIGQVTVLTLDDAGGPGAIPALTGLYAAETADNLHGPREELASTGRLNGHTRVAITPLRHEQDGRLRTFSFDVRTPQMFRAMSVRRTRQLSAVDAALAGGARTVAEVEATALPPGAPDSSRANLRDFLGMLAGLNILQVSEPPRRDCTDWATAGTAPRYRQADTFVDVYRRADSPLPAGMLHVVEAGVRQALRIHALIRSQRPARPPGFLQRLTSAPRPVLDVMAERADELLALPSTAAAGQGERPLSDVAWTAERIAGTGYDRLLDWIDAHTGHTPIRITPEALDTLGAPEVDLTWPLDVTVRPDAEGERMVLNMLQPAGILDARFVEAIETLHGPLPTVDAYREFLAHLDEITGVTSVELLMPPLLTRAANAVRRPSCTSLWTGDPDRAGYGAAPEGRPAGFVPLGALDIRRDGDRVVVTTGGRPLRFLRHTTRQIHQPWNLINTLLSTESPHSRWSTHRLRCPLAALPHRDHLPRLELGSHLVLSPAQWRLTAADLGDPDAAETTRLRTMIRLRDRLGLPRWVMVRSGPNATPFPCDLESLTGIDTLHHPFARDTGPDLPVFIEEMLPAPADVPRLEPGGGRLAAEIMLRLSGGHGPAALAALAAADTGPFSGAPAIIDPATARKESRCRRHDAVST
jgi:hypothetical protein